MVTFLLIIFAFCAGNACGVWLLGRALRGLDPQAFDNLLYGKGK